MDIRRLNTVLLDTSACVYFLDEPVGSPRSRVVSPFVRAAERGKLRLLLSPVTVAELLVRPMRDRHAEDEARARLFVEAICQTVDLTSSGAVEAARLRAAYAMSMPDALILAAAVASDVDAVLGNDRRWKRIPDIDYRHIDDHLPRAEA